MICAVKIKTDDNEQTDSSYLNIGFGDFQIDDICKVVLFHSTV